VTKKRQIRKGKVIDDRLQLGPQKSGNEGDPDRIWVFNAREKRKTENLESGEV